MLRRAECWRLQWYYLSTVLDDFSRYILAWTLGRSMGATDVMATLDLAWAAAGIDRVPVVHRADPALDQLTSLGQDADLAFLLCRSMPIWSMAGPLPLAPLT